MYCWNCGKEMNDNDAFCGNCGKPATNKTEHIQPVLKEEMSTQGTGYESKRIKPLAVIIVLFIVALVGMIVGINISHTKKEDKRGILSDIHKPKRGDILTEDEIKNLDWELNMFVMDGKLLTFPICEADLPDNVAFSKIDESSDHDFLSYFGNDTDVALQKKIILFSNRDEDKYEYKADCYNAIRSGYWYEDDHLFTDKLIFPGGIYLGMPYEDFLESLAYLNKELEVEYQYEHDAYILYLPGEYWYDVPDVEKKGGMEITLDESGKNVDYITYADMTDYFYDIDESSKEDEESSVDMEEILSAYEESAAEVMDENGFTPEYVQYELIYVDDDDIPECVAGYNGNSMLFTYKDGEVISLPEELFMNWSDIYYIERTGKIRYDQIASPYHWYYYYTLEDGEITLEETKTELTDEEYEEYEGCSVYMDDGYDDVWEAADEHGIEY